ncbi:ABC transporter substrate-binding protein [Paenibacillus kobensis]|uniref:ABC transporter substrate-binding protein n=1 Tax=Paenibacillus kobensis TaxID=59841 RepID=UPI000FDB7B75|nr:extracellular solute-binding protein [Paenibacillus kobensis]
MKRVLNFVLLTALCMLAPLGCSSKPSSDNPLLRDDAALTIGYRSSQEFEKRYPQLLKNEFPNLNYTVISNSEVWMDDQTPADWMAQHPADLVYVPYTRMKEFISEGLILDLSSFIKTGRLQLDSYVPAAIELAKQLGDGNLYGIPPSIDSRVIVYNKTLFEQQKIDFPSPPLTWDQFLLLSQRFPYGLAALEPAPIFFLTDIGSTLGYRLYQTSPPASLVDNPGWQSVWAMVEEPIAKQNIRFGDIDDFISGKCAMAIINYRQYATIEHIKPDFQWELAPMPIDPQNPDSSPLFSAEGFYAISAQTAYPDAALELLKFLTSSTAAKWEVNIYGISSNKSVTPSDYLAAVGQLTPSPYFDDIPAEFIGWGNEAILSIQQGISREDALAAYKQKTSEFVSGQSSP